MKRRTTKLMIATAAAVAAAYAPAARAGDTTRRADEAPRYRIEIEPRADAGIDRVYGTTLFGAGLQLAVPILKNGFLDGVNDNVAIAFGADILRYNDCVDRTCGGTFLVAPVAMQWNFFVADRFSVFGEPGVFFYRGFFEQPLSRSRAGFGPVVDVGGRYHLSDRFALTLRVGYPTTSIGLSFM